MCGACPYFDLETLLSLPIQNQGWDYYNVFTLDTDTHTITCRQCRKVGVTSQDDPKGFIAKWMDKDAIQKAAWVWHHLAALQRQERARPPLCRICRHDELAVENEIDMSDRELESDPVIAGRVVTFGAARKRIIGGKIAK